MLGVPGMDGKGKIFWLIELGVLGVPVRYCSIFASRDVFSGSSLRGGTIERLSTERDQPFREILRRSPDPFDPVGEALFKSVLVREERSSTDLISAR